MTGHARGRLAAAAWSGRLLLPLLAVAVLLLSPPPAAAQALEGADEVGGALPGFDGWDWLGLGLRLGLVLLVIWGAVFVMRWYVRRTAASGGPAGASGQLHVLDSRSLGPNRSLQLVRLGGRAVLLGVTQERITPLLEIDDEDEVERYAAAIEEAEAARSFRDLLAGIGGPLRLVVGGLRMAVAGRERRRERDTQASGYPVSVGAVPAAPRGPGVPRSVEAAGGYRGVRLSDIAPDSYRSQEPVDPGRASLRDAE